MAHASKICLHVKRRVRLKYDHPSAAQLSIQAAPHAFAGPDEFMSDPDLPPSVQEVVINAPPSMPSLIPLPSPRPNTECTTAAPESFLPAADDVESVAEQLS